MACFQHVFVACAHLLSPAQPNGTPVDLEPVLASDISLSVDSRRKSGQDRGFLRSGDEISGIGAVLMIAQVAGMMPTPILAAPAHDLVDWYRTL
jgi:hypothetical protein